MQEFKKTPPWICARCGARFAAATLLGPNGLVPSVWKYKNEWLCHDCLEEAHGAPDQSTKCE